MEIVVDKAQLQDWILGSDFIVNQLACHASLSLWD